jgi:ABC-type transport system involved in cytochrome c biogenesis permease component
MIALIVKDLRAEFRASYAVLSAFVFALSSVFLAAVPLSGTVTPIILSMLFWVVLFFSVSQFLSRLFVRETEEGTFLLLRQRYSPDAVFAAKTVINAAVSCAVCAFVLLLFYVFFRTESFPFARFVPMAFTGSVSLACALSLGGALCAMSGGRGGLFTVISIPAAFPVLLFSINEGAGVLSGSISCADAVIFGLAYGACLFCVSVFLFRFLWRE